MAGKVLVVGAKSKVGAELVRMLEAESIGVAAATRSPKADNEVMFDYDEPAEWRAALSGVDRAFVIARPGDPEADKVLLPFFDNLRQEGVQRVVFMTAMGVDADEEIPLRKAERYLEGLGLSHTFLRPNWFNQNFNLGFLHDSIVKMGGIFVPAEDAKVSFVDVRDIAAVAMKALTEDGHGGKGYTLTGPEALSHGEVASILSEVAGREIKYVSVAESDARGALAQAGWQESQIDFMMNLFAVIRQGYAAPVSPDVRAALGRDPIRFRDFAREFADAWKA